MPSIYRLIMIIVCLAHASGSVSQEHPDTIYHNASVSPYMEPAMDSISTDSYNPSRASYLSYMAWQNTVARSHMPRFRYQEPLWGTIAYWDGGGMFGSTAAATMPGMMAIEQGRLNMIQYIGNFTLSAYAKVSKYGYYGGLITSVGYGGSMSYDFNHAFSVTLFGHYNTNVNMPGPALNGYAGMPSFGGYFDWRINDRWGIKAGAQAYRTSLRQWQAQPIVMPYYRISKDAAIGIDVGGIIYNALRSQKSSRATASNPTIAPPASPQLTFGHPSSNPYGY